MENKKPSIIARDKEHLQKLIREEIERNGNECDLNFIDTSKIKDMSFLFYQSKFNGKINQWDTSNVKDMSCIFLESIFNGDISQWNTCNVNDMRGLFAKSLFNGNISQWDTSNVKNMLGMFFHSNFKGDISSWNIFNVEEIENIFNNSQLQNIPYWAKIEDFQERQKAYLTYQEKKLLKSKISVPQNHKKEEVFKI